MSNRTLRPVVILFATATAFAALSAGGQAPVKVSPAKVAPATVAPVKVAPAAVASIDAVAIANAELPQGLRRTPQLDQVVTDLRAGRTEQANGAFREYLAGAQRIGAVDVNTLVQWVLRESYLQTTEDLRAYAEKVKYFNTTKKQVREYLQELRDYSQSMARSPAPAARTLRCLNWPKLDVRPCTLTRDQIDKEIAAWEEKLNGLGDDAQLANVDLQNVLQKQQQTLQMMSNISKMLHDTASNVIRKIGG